ncbi:MAG: molybdopterin oxidoreductase [Dictyoglomus sp. NZ13-RE01]|nr:MAG: molybdopterin oxidoreductase [Dictyoglomus sp. NZ13-RE01]
MIKKFVCVQCPLGCKLTVELNGNEIVKIEGNRCKRGIEYAEDEIKDPKRVLTTSIKVIGGNLPLVSVRTDKPIPKRYIKEIMEIIKEKEVKAPVKRGDVIIQNIMNTGANIIATRSVEKL